MITYGQSIVWTERDGSVTTVSVSDCVTPDEARGKALKSARLFGWAPPRWWQWWRRSDTRLPAPPKTD